MDRPAWLTPALAFSSSLLFSRSARAGGNRARFAGLGQNSTCSCRAGNRSSGRRSLHLRVSLAGASGPGFEAECQPSEFVPLRQTQ